MKIDLNLKNLSLWVSFEVFIGLLTAIIVSVVTNTIAYFYGYLLGLIFILATVFVSLFFLSKIKKSFTNIKTLKKFLFFFYTLNVIILVLLLITIILIKLIVNNEVSLLYGLLIGAIDYLLVFATIKVIWIKKIFSFKIKQQEKEE